MSSTTSMSMEHIRKQCHWQDSDDFGKLPCLMVLSSVGHLDK